MQAWIPMHWGPEFLSGRAPDGANADWFADQGLSEIAVTSP